MQHIFLGENKIIKINEVSQKLIIECDCGKCGNASISEFNKILEYQIDLRISMIILVHGNHSYLDHDGLYIDDYMPKDVGIEPICDCGVDWLNKQGINPTNCIHDYWIVNKKIPNAIVI